jgi:hypothetical protein
MISNRFFLCYEIIHFHLQVFHHKVVKETVPGTISFNTFKFMYRIITNYSKFIYRFITINHNIIYRIITNALSLRCRNITYYRVCSIETTCYN